LNILNETGVLVVTNLMLTFVVLEAKIGQLSINMQTKKVISESIIAIFLFLMIINFVFLGKEFFKSCKIRKDKLRKINLNAQILETSLLA